MVFESGDTQRLRKADSIVIRLNDGCYAFNVVDTRSFDTYALVSLEGIETADQAEMLRDGELLVSDPALPALDPDEYYIHRLIGCNVRSEDGEELGSLKTVMEMGHHDIWCVEGEYGEILIPARKEFIVRVDPDARLIVVRNIQGLWNDR